LVPYFYKRLSFAHENELRAIIQEIPLKNGKADMKNPKYEHGQHFNVDLTILIERLFVSPTSPPWILDIIKSICYKYGLTTPIIKSSLYESLV
jgi:hypothetical protein